MANMTACCELAVILRSVCQTFVHAQARVHGDRTCCADSLGVANSGSPVTSLREFGLHALPRHLCQLVSIDFLDLCRTELSLLLIDLFIRLSGSHCRLLIR